MRVGRHYKVQEIQPRHFQELARMCNYPGDGLLDTLLELAERLPDEARDLAEQVAGSEVTRDVLGQLVDKLASQCRLTVQRVRAAA